MDRQILYPAQIPLVEDGLNAQRNAMVGLGHLAGAAFGANTVAASGFACLPAEGLAVTIAPGALLAPGVVDASAYGTLAAVSSALVRQFISRDPVSLTVPSAGATYVVYVTPQTVDADNTVLPFYNAADPSVTYAGQNNSGLAAPTVRRDEAVLAIGSSIPSGAYPLWQIVVPAGATTLTADMLSIASGAPFYPSLAAVASRIIAPFNAQLAVAIGGYPLNAVVADPATPGTFWVSTADANVSTPGASGAMWQSLFNGYIPTIAPNPRVGDMPLANLYYAGGLRHVWAAVNASTYGELAWLSDVTTVQANLTTAIANQADTNADVQAKMRTLVSGAPRISTDAQGVKLVYAAGSTSPDGVARPQFYFNGGNRFLATTLDTAALSSRLTSEIATRSDQVSDLNTQMGNRIVGLAGSGYITVQSLTVNQTSQNLTLNLGNGVVAQQYAQVQTGIINNAPMFGWWKKTRLPDGSWLLEQEYVVTGLAGNAAHNFPIAFASSPVISLTASNDTGSSNQHKSIFPNYMQGSLTAVGVTLDVFYYDNANRSCALSSDFILSVRAVGPVAS